MSSPPRIVRELARVSSQFLHDEGDAAVKALVRETDARARATAKCIGIKRMSITRMWSPWFPTLEYPMRLLGEGAPQIRTCRDALSHSGLAEYQIVIRDRDEP